MTRKGFRNRSITFPGSFVRPIPDPQPDFAHDFSMSGQEGVRPRRIFIIKQTTRLESTNGVHKKMRRILIFDDHPDSLRLVFGGSAKPHVDLSTPQRVSSWELILFSILTVGALVGMFWPLF
jgi:hypothetical protein